MSCRAAGGSPGARQRGRLAQGTSEVRSLALERAAKALMEGQPREDAIRSPSVLGGPMQAAEVASRRGWFGSWSFALEFMPSLFPFPRQDNSTSSKFRLRKCPEASHVCCLICISLTLMARPPHSKATPRDLSALLPVMGEGLQRWWLRDSSVPLFNRQGLQSPLHIPPCVCEQGTSTVSDSITTE